jgi:hypothetical protein
MSLLWAELHHAHVQTSPLRHVTDTGTEWVNNVLCFFWDRFFILRTSRNEVVFGSTLTESRQSTVQKVLVELRALQSNRAQYRPCDVSFLMSPSATDDYRTFTDTIRRQGVSRVQDWVETWKPYSLTGFCCFLCFLISQDLRSFPRSSPPSLQRPFPTTCLTDSSPPTQSRTVSFPIYLRILSAFFFLILPSSTFITTK